MFAPATRKMTEYSVSEKEIVKVMLAFPNLSIADYATRLGTHPTTLIKTLGSVSFKAALAAERAESLADAAVLAESLAVRAVNTIAMVMDNPFAADKDRVAASKALIEVGIKLSEAVHSTPQLELLKAQLEEEGIKVKHAKKFERRRGSPTPIESASSVPVEIETPEVVEPAGVVMDRIKSILRNGNHST